MDAQKQQLKADKRNYLHLKDNVYQEIQRVVGHIGEAEMKRLLAYTRTYDDRVQIIDQELAELKMRKKKSYANIYEAKAGIANLLSEE